VQIIAPFVGHPTTFLLYENTLGRGAPKIYFTLEYFELFRRGMNKYYYDCVCDLEEFD